MKTDGSGYLVPKNNTPAAYATIGEVTSNSSSAQQKTSLKGEYIVPDGHLVNLSYEAVHPYASIDDAADNSSTVQLRSKNAVDDDDGYAVPDEFGFSDENIDRHDTMRESDYVGIETHRLNLQDDVDDDEVA